MFAQGILESHLELASRRGTKRVRVEYIRLFKQEITEFKRMGGRHYDKRIFGLTDLRTNGPSD